MHKSLDESEIWPDATTGFHGNSEGYNVKNGVITFARNFLAHLSRKLIGELLGYSWSGLHTAMVFRPSVRRCQQCSDIFFSETACPMKAKCYVEPPLIRATKFKFCSRHMGHKTKIAAMPQYG